MRKLLLLLSLLLPIWVGAAEPVTVDVQVQGMSCPFCVYGVQKSLRKLPGVASAQVDLKSGHASVIMLPGQEPDVEAIRKAILDAGFTPKDVTVHRP